MHCMLDEDGLDHGTLQRLKRFPNFHHSSPLTLFPQKHIISQLNGDSSLPEIRLFKQVKCRVLQLGKELRHRLIFTDDATPFYTTVLRISKERGGSEHTNSSGILVSALTGCIREVIRDLKSVNNHHPGVGDLKQLLQILPSDLMRVSSDIGSCFKLYRALCRTRNAIQQAHVSGDGDTGTMIQLLGPYQCYAVNEILLLFNFYDKSEPILIINYDQLLMLTDTVACRLMCRLTCALNDIFKKDDLPSQDLILKIYSWGDRVILKHGMCGYALIGEFESIVTNSFVNFPGSDPLCLGEPFFESIIETSKELEAAHGIDPHFTVELIELLSSITSPNQLSEIFGVRKHWGNPIVDASVSGRAVQDKVQEVLPVDGPSVLKLQASFNRLITLEYIRKNGKWPECIFAEDQKDCLLYICWRNKITRIPESAPNHSHYHWALMRFLPNCVLDSYKDQLSLLSDKSVSLYRPHLMHMYVRALVNQKFLKEEPPENRRLMLEFLRKPHMPVLDILKTVMANEIPFDWLCNSSSMKGTEMKYLKARIFAVLTFELRQYFAVSEDMIKEHVFKYNPHQTMTMNEIALLDKLREITKQLQSQVNSKTLNVIHIIDFSKWNLRMRYENTCTVFKSIDDFLGTPGLIERTHLIFESLINVVQDAFNPPTEHVEETFSDTVWKFHSCGWEGQRQKGWTVITSALLSYIELLTGVSSEICGQGDNQVLLTKFPIPSKFISAHDWISAEPLQVRAILDDYYSRLEEECGKVGLKVKTAESCRSLCYLNYGKRLYFNGVELSMSLKRIGKMFTEPNDSYPTTEGRLKTMEGSIYAAGLYGHPGLLPYLMSRVGVYLNLDESYRFNPLISDSVLKYMAGSNCYVDSKFITQVMKIPPSLGGPPQQLLPAYLCRGHPDPLCTDLVISSLRSDSGDDFSRRLLSLVDTGQLFRGYTESKESLIMSPYSLNLGITVSARKPLENKVLEAVEFYCKNPQIRGLFTSNMRTITKAMIQDLSTMTPFHPLVANDIFERSPPGRRKAFLAGLSNSTSLGRLVYDNSMSPVIEKVCELEKRQLIYWFTYQKDIMKSQINNATIGKRHDQLAQEFRDTSWGCKVEGVTVPHPLGQFSLCLSSNDICTKSCKSAEPEHIVCVQHSEDLISLSNSSDHRILLSRSCEGAPYLGNVINEGLTQKEVHCDTPERPFLDAVRLNIIRRWVTNEGTMMDDFIQTIIKSKTDTPIDILDRVSGRPSRLSFSHRAALMGTVRSSAHCSTSNLHTRFYLSSNRMGEFSHGEMNYHLPFGPAFLILQGLLCWRSVLLKDQVYDMSNQRLIFHFHVANRDIPPVYDGGLTLSSSKVQIPNNIPDLLFSQYEKLEFTDLTGKSLSPLWSSYDHAPTHHSKILYASQLIGNGFVNEIVHHELASTETAQQYPPRLSQVSIGDVSLIGPITFCEALAHHVLLFAPARIFTLTFQSMFEVSVFRFLNNFSRKFWNSLAGPMSFHKNLQSLVRSCPHLVNYNSTKTTSGVVTLMKTVIAQHSWRLWEDLKHCVVRGSRTPRLLLSAPSVSALRTVVARYMEMCVYVFLDVTNTPTHEVMALGRDLVANIHACTLKDFPLAFQLCKDYFRVMTMQLTDGDFRLMPQPSMYYLQQPWIDRIRGISTEPVTRPLLSHEAKFMLDPHFIHKVSYDLPDYPIWIAKQECTCPAPPRSYSLHWECYFQVTGILSKSAYKFLEVILTYNLPVRGVLCLGTSTGSEAASISRLKENEKVYVNCFHKMSSFAPHAAATYIPPSFLMDGDPSKLVSAAASALSTNDLTDTKCIEAILDQISVEDYTGITCDAEIPTFVSDQVFRDILSNILVLCSKLPNCKWVLIKIPVNCPHSVHSYLSDFSRLFNKCDIVYCSFNRQKTRNFHFLAETKKPVLLPIGPAGEVVLTLEDHIVWRDILIGVDNQKHPACFTIGHSHMLTKVKACNVVSSSFNAACFNYINGWGGSYSHLVSIPGMVRDLIQFMELVHEELIKLLLITYRALSGIPMIRAGILERSDTEVQRQINEICYVYLRAGLLVKLLQKDSRDFDEINSFIYRYLGTNHKIPLQSTDLYVTLDQSRYVSNYSRYLFEILGHMYGCSLIVANHYQLPVIHQQRNSSAHIHTSFPEILHVSYTDMRCEPDHSWKWLKRCFIMSLLMIRAEDPSPLVGVCRYNHVLDSPAADALKLHDFYESAADNSQVTYYWVEAKHHLEKLQLVQPIWVVYNQSLYMEISRRFIIDRTYALPWSGVVPSKLMSRCIDYGETRHREGRFVDIDQIGRRINRSGISFAGCSCYSCSLEVEYTRKHGISSSQLDVLCSGLYLTNVLYKYHSSTD